MLSYPSAISLSNQTLRYLTRTTSTAGAGTPDPDLHDLGGCSG